MIRPAQDADASELVRMRTALWPDEPDAHAAAVAAYLAGDSPHIDMVLVSDASGGRLVGFVELRLRREAEGAAGSPVPYVEGWYVDPSHRGRGVGRALIGGAEAWARANGYRELASDAELDNDGSIAAHRALGFDEVVRTVAFVKRL